MGAWTGACARLATPRDGAGLSAFRLLFGAVMAFSVARFWARGWIDSILVAPAFHFTYLGFEWVRPWPGPWMYVHFAVMGAAALLLAAGAFTRTSALVFFATFTWAELVEKAAYLNHYYFVSLVALLLVVLPSGACGSVDAWRARRRGRPAPGAVGSWAYLLLRAQIGLVWFFAGFAKLEPDWLLDAQPLRTWLRACAEAPIVGRFAELPAIAYAMSWGGAAYDLAIPFLLAWPRTRRWAFAAVVAFHLAVWRLFPIGVFSPVMIAAATVFLDPAWPRRVLSRLARLRPERAIASAPPVPPAASAAPLPAAAALALGAWVAVQALLPLRFLLHPGNVLWTEEGFRFAWRVMLMEKTGQVEFRVETGAPEGRWVVHPRTELTALQHRQLVTQPDLIHEYALHLAALARARGARGVRVYADAWASLHGRPAQRLVRPDVDLAALARTAPRTWIVPLAPRGTDAR